MSSNSIKLQKLYIAFFGRPCDPSGMRYWLTKLESETQLIDVAESFSTQVEYTHGLTSENSVEFQVNQIYLNLFARKADFDSLNSWSLKLKKGELKLYDMTIIKGSFFDNRISLRVKPLSNDIKALREMYLDVDIANSSFVAYKE